MPCVSEGTLLVCAGVLGTTELYNAGLLGEGLSGSYVEADGYAAGAAGEDLNVTVPSSDLPAGQDDVSIQLNVFTVNVSNSCGLCIGAGGSPSYIYADSPSGSFLPSDTQEVAGPLSTLSLGIPGVDTVSTALSVSEAGYGALKTVLDGISNPSNVTPCAILAGALFAQAVYAAAGAVSSAIPSASCQESPFTWNGIVTGGQPFHFDVQPTAFAVDFGFGTIMSTLFGLATAQVTITPGSETTTTTPTTTTVSPLPLLIAVATNGQHTWTGREPNTMGFSVDEGNIVTNLMWSSWTTTQAVGNGTWTYDDCVPDCAGGSTTPYPATIVLSDPVNGVFTYMTETTAGPHGLTSTYTYPDNWVLSAT